MEYLPAWMFLVLTILLLVGFPVTFTLMGTALCFGLIGFGWTFFNLLPLRIWGVMGNVTLLAVPLFVFMGVMLERSGLAEELLDTMGLLFGRLRGGLAISVVVVGALLGASTGIVGATVVTMGLLAVPTMLRRGYQKELVAGTVDQLIRQALQRRGDVRVCPCRTIVPLYREHVIAQVKPSTKTRVDFGLALKGAPREVPARLIATGGLEKGDRITHRIPLPDPSEIDDELWAWFDIAYDLDG